MSKTLQVLQVISMFVNKQVLVLIPFQRSNVLETQLKALGKVTSLASENPHIRQVLSTVLCQSYLIPKYKEKELYLSCCKAKISIKDNEVHEFWLHFSQSYLHSESHLCQWNNEDKAKFNQVISYFK